MTSSITLYWHLLVGQEKKLMWLFIPPLRDSRLLSIGGGADEVMLGIIAKYMDTLPRKWLH